MQPHTKDKCNAHVMAGVSSKKAASIQDELNTAPSGTLLTAHQLTGQERLEGLQHPRRLLRVNYKLDYLQFHTLGGSLKMILVLNSWLPP